MLSLSSALSTALGVAVQQPALLVEMGFSTVRRWSSFSTVSWNGSTWFKEAISIEDLSVEALRVAGSLRIGNGDDVIGALLLNEGAADKRIRIWGYDAAATALADVVLLCDAAGSAATIGAGSVSISLRAPSEFLLAPRTFINAEAGFSPLLPAGTALKINGLDYQLGSR